MNPYGNGGYYPIWRGSQVRYSRVEYPSPNPYLDSGGIHLLYAAFTIDKSADLVSDLTAHFRDRLARADGEEKVYPLVALSALHYWNDEKDEAIDYLTQAADLTANDAELKLNLADLYERSAQADEALAVLDKIEPLDAAIVRRKELAALRISVSIGSVDRARKAAERLFGLRLDTELQTNLAGQMHQLGMHEAAETILARATTRRKPNAGASRLDESISTPRQKRHRRPSRHANLAQKLRHQLESILLQPQ